MCISVRRLWVLERLPRGRSDHKLQLMTGAEIEGIRIQSLYLFLKFSITCGKNTNILAIPLLLSCLCYSLLLFQSPPLT